MNSSRPLRVLHLITRMNIAGAQENTMLSCALVDRARFSSDLLCGPDTSAGQLHDECRARGIPVNFLSTLVRPINPRRDLAAIPRLTRFMRRGRYDIVHTHSSKAGILGRIAAKLARVPVVIHTVHGWSFNDEQSKLIFNAYVRAEKLCAPLCDALVVVASPDAVLGQKLGIGKREQYRLIRSGIEVSSYRDAPTTKSQARALLGIPDDAFVVGSVGRLSPQKAPLDLARAFAMLAKVRPDAHLVLVGDGELRGEVETFAAQHDLTNRVHLAGMRRDVADVQRAFDVFALSSRWEGLPRVFPQAMAAGLPLVATRVAGAPDAITQGENGFLVPVGDMESLGARLIELAQDRALLERMGASSEQRVEEFSVEAMIRGLETLYSELAVQKKLR